MRLLVSSDKSKSKFTLAALLAVILSVVLFLLVFFLVYSNCWPAPPASSTQLARLDCVEGTGRAAFFTVARAAIALLRMFGRGRGGVPVRVRCV